MPDLPDTQSDTATSTRPIERACCDEAHWFRASDDVRKSYVRGIDAFDVKPIEYSVIDEVAIFEGDIALGSAQSMEALRHEVEGAASPGIHDAPSILHGIGVTGQRYRWPNGVIPWSSTPALRPLVMSAIAHWEANTPIRFVERTSANAANHRNWMSFEARNGCYSNVGMQGGMQVISLGAGCGFGPAVHEIGHAVGLWHEQSREDRDRHVRIRWENIQPGRENNFTQQIADGDDLGSYDYRSIMHYGPTAFGINNQVTIEPLHAGAIGQRLGLSPGDIAAVRAMYPQLEPSRSWRGTQFSGAVRAHATGRWSSHSWPSHWFVAWHAMPTAPAAAGVAQLECKVSTTRQSDQLLTYFFAISNLSDRDVCFETRFDVLGWTRSFT